MSKSYSKYCKKYNTSKSCTSTVNICSVILMGNIQEIAPFVHLTDFRRLHLHFCLKLNLTWTFLAFAYFDSHSYTMAIFDKLCPQMKALIILYKSMWHNIPQIFKFWNIRIYKSFTYFKILKTWIILWLLKELWFNAKLIQNSLLYSFCVLNFPTLFERKSDL